MKLLTVGRDAKTPKGEKMGYLTGILYLAPANEAGTGYDLCPMRTPECTAACLYGAGMAQVFPAIKEGRIRKTISYISNPKGFVGELRVDIQKLKIEALVRGLIPAVRLNGTSDIPKLAIRLAGEFPDIQFYDYTKIPRPWERARSNYHLTFSFSGHNLADCHVAIAHGVNVAVVFSGPLPKQWEGYPVMSGDDSDLRFLDPRGVVIGLKAKGAARGVVNKFVQIGR